MPIFFDMVKLMLSVLPVLASPNFQQQFELSVDASDAGTVVPCSNKQLREESCVLSPTSVKSSLPAIHVLQLLKREFWPLF